MHAAQLKSKKHPHAGKLKRVSIEMPEDDGPGASVHTLHHPKTMHEYPSEVHAGSYGTKEEALHAAAKHMGAKVEMSDDDEASGASDEGGGPVLSKK